MQTRRCIYWLFIISTAAFSFSIIRFSIWILLLIIINILRSWTKKKNRSWNVHCLLAVTKTKVTKVTKTKVTKTKNRSWHVQSNNVSKFDRKGIHYHDVIYKNVNMCNIIVMSVFCERGGGGSIYWLFIEHIIMMCFISNFWIKVLYSFIVPITSALSSLKSIWIKKMLVKLFNLKLSNI